MGLSVVAMTRWSKLLNIPPTVPAHASHKWSEADAKRLADAYRQHWLKQRRKKTKR